jgi:uncharacterized OB-fold protein
MSARSVRPDLASLEVPWDVWGEPFWKATAERILLMPSCADCATFRWPPGPFCAKCHSQNVVWAPPGQGRIYSFTVLPVAATDKDAPPQYRVPVLVEFDHAAGVRLVSALIDAPLDNIAIGARVEVDWLAAANATVPVFRLLTP